MIRRFKPVLAALAVATLSLSLAAPPAAAELLPHLPELAPLKSCRAKLLDLADAAWEQQGKPDIRDLVRGP